jgi:formylglycine-generating enzyme required for sulfatase activity
MGDITLQKKYCHNCFQVMDAALMQCDRCQYLQPTSFNPTYLKPPYRLNNQYILGRVLGHGGFAITYLGYDRHLGSRVAIKEYFPAEFAMRAPDGEKVIPYAGEKQTLFQLGKEKFMVEARLLATLRNPNTIRIRHFFEGCNTAYFVMEYLEGQTLKEYIASNGGQISWRRTKQVLWPLLDALEEVHLKQCYHRDIKPENIYITQRGEPILLDFGAARQQMSGATTNLLAFLTPGYAPAEQYSANGIQGPWTDIYALAATMYYALTGMTPPVPQDRALGEAELVPPSKLGVNIPPREEAWLLKGLEVKWSHRPESIHDWRRTMEKMSVTTTMELKSEEMAREMEMAFLRSAILPRLTSRILSLDDVNEIFHAAQFAGMSIQKVEALIEQALLMTGSERREVPKTPEPQMFDPEPPAPDPVFEAPSPAQPVAPPAPEEADSSRQRVVEQKLSHAQQASVNPLIRKALNPEDSGGLPPRIRNSLGMEFVLIKPFVLENGEVEFIRINMGSENQPYYVTLTHPYYLQTTQVTQGQWRVVMGQNPARFSTDDWQPVEQISWDEAAPFMQRLNMLNEGFYRLPTEAEWEYACRAGSETLYSFGDNEDQLVDHAWFDGNAQGRPHAVGMKRPNRWGLYDMHGNVWEWIADRFGPYPGGEVTDPKGPDRGNSRVMRGGSWSLGASYCRTGSRNYESSSYKSANLGIRLLLEAH